MKSPHLGPVSSVKKCINWLPPTYFESMTQKACYPTTFLALVTATKRQLAIDNFKYARLNMCSCFLQIRLRFFRWNNILLKDRRLPFSSLNQWRFKSKFDSYILFRFVPHKQEKQTFLSWVLFGLNDRVHYRLDRTDKNAFFLYYNNFYQIWN